VTDCVAAKSAATKGGTNSSSAATANVAAKAAKHAVKKAASAKPKEKKSASGKTTAAAVPLPRARPDSSGAFAPARAATRGTSTGLPQPPAVPLAQTPTPQTSDPDVALVKSAIDSLRSGGADKATGVQATISDPAARKLVEWIILRSDRNGAGSARYTAFIAANPSWPSLAMFRRRAEALLWVENVKPAQVLGFFNGSPPQSGMGRLVLARALHAQGDTEGARAQVREAWRNDPMSADVEKQVAMKWRSTREFSLVGSAASRTTRYADRASPISSDLAVVAQNVHVREDVAGIVARFRRHGVKQLLVAQPTIPPNHGSGQARGGRTASLARLRPSSPCAPCDRRGSGKE
jgi:hypothetical protein